MNRRTAATAAGRRRGRRSTSQVKPAARALKRHATKVVTNPWAERAARLGYIVRGCIYGTMGVLALELALGGTLDTTDQRGALALLDANPATRVFMVLAVASLLAYAVWGFIRAIY